MRMKEKRWYSNTTKAFKTMCLFETYLSDYQKTRSDICEKCAVQKQLACRDTEEATTHTDNLSRRQTRRTTHPNTPTHRHTQTHTPLNHWRRFGLDTEANKRIHLCSLIKTGIRRRRAETHLNALCKEWLPSVRSSTFVFSHKPCTHSYHLAFYHGQQRKSYTQKNKQHLKHWCAVRLKKSNVKAFLR